MAFSTFQLKKIYTDFHVVEKKESPVSLETATLTQVEQEILTTVLQRNIRIFSPQWSEIDRREKLIYPILLISYLQRDDIFYWDNQKLAATDLDKDLFGEPDYMINENPMFPDLPYFVIVEAKGKENIENYWGQLLAEMLAAAWNNHKARQSDAETMLGALTDGLIWQFITLTVTDFEFNAPDRNAYIKFPPYYLDVRKDEDVLSIIGVLRQVKKTRDDEEDTQS